jgi:hypothetical protein
VVAVPLAAAAHNRDVAVDVLHDPEGHLRVAVGRDPLNVALKQARELLEGGELLPAEGPDPGGGGSLGRALVGVPPQVLQLPPELVRNGVSWC